METNYQKKITELEKKLATQQNEIANKELIIEVAQNLSNSKMSNDERIARLITMNTMSIDEIREFNKILKEEVQAYNDIYLKALEKTQKEEQTQK